MHHRKPLTAAELAEIYNREPTPTVLRLLQEIHRLRATVMRADQIRRMIGAGGTAYVAGTVWECFERELNAEPCLTDPQTPRQEQRTEAAMRRLEERRKNGRKD
ncbi:hypothetical protein DR64_714 [Paraburkholderia xenovorans LB400]|uniref:Uncharacterized protein n=2 Tax=Paraburkholderia xenovorans TaxID=36873 RepID=Q141P7_PARXL|nr:hypothetical protein Bxe_A3037 [Paraburkholderia xenovorans LB400]AIP31636.1 hypothetical protein DR64_714 [Paraburkholderia xenovorans LB400]